MSDKLYTIETGQQFEDKRCNIITYTDNPLKKILFLDENGQYQRESMHFIKGQEVFRKTATSGDSFNSWHKDSETGAITYLQSNVDWKNGLEKIFLRDTDILDAESYFLPETHYTVGNVKYSPMEQGKSFVKEITLLKAPFDGSLELQTYIEYDGKTSLPIFVQERGIGVIVLKKDDKEQARVVKRRIIPKDNPQETFIYLQQAMNEDKNRPYDFYKIPEAPPIFRLFDNNHRLHTENCGGMDLPIIIGDDAKSSSDPFITIWQEAYGNLPTMLIDPNKWTVKESIDHIKKLTF